MNINKQTPFFLLKIYDFFTMKTDLVNLQKILFLIAALQNYFFSSKSTPQNRQDKFVAKNIKS